MDAAARGKSRHTFEGAEYVAGRYNQAYTILSDRGLWKIKRYRGGLLPRVLNTQFTSFKAAEETLIAYLITQNRHWRQSKYPGCPEHKPQKSTEPS